MSSAGRGRLLPVHLLDRAVAVLAADRHLLLHAARDLGAGLVRVPAVDVVARVAVDAGEPRVAVGEREEGVVEPGALPRRAAVALEAVVGVVARDVVRRAVELGRVAREAVRRDRAEVVARVALRAGEGRAEAPLQEMRRVGADVVFTPYNITGYRLAQALLRPQVSGWATASSLSMATPPSGARSI
mgnify:CR=1 FL=1